MGIGHSRHARYEHVPLLTEMEQLSAEDERPRPLHHHHQQQPHTADLPQHYFFSNPLGPPLTSAPLAPTAGGPTAFDPHHANFTFYRSSIPPRHAQSRKLSKLRRVLLCGGGGSGSGRRSKKGMVAMHEHQQVKGRGYRDDEDNLSVAESYTSSLKSSASSISIVNALHVTPKIGGARMCDVKERKGLLDE